MKEFNVTGQCIPADHYMVDISGKIAQIKELIDKRRYFTINRARQYGKTTMLYELRRRLADEYTVVIISFQGFDDESFESSKNFCSVFVKSIAAALKFSTAPKEYIEKWANADMKDFNELSSHITKVCENEKIVLLVDEVDRTSNNRVFLKFLDMLRSKFLARNAGDDCTFHSVILAGVHDIKNIKLKLVSEGLHMPAADDGTIYNSPWNIAVDFEVDMSFNAYEISTMLNDYEAEHKTSMDIARLSQEIYGYTNGYPFLVSRLCKHIDEKLNKNWTVGGVQKAVQILLLEKNTLFDNLFKNLENNAELYELMYNILIVGEDVRFNPDNPVLDIAFMYGIVKRSGLLVRIANRIFEIRICDYFISKDELKKKKKGNGVL